MVLTRETLVHQAYGSSAHAPALFAAHGIRPAEKCAVVWDEASLDDAELWCHVRDLDALITESSAAAGNRETPLASSRAGMS